MKKSSLALASVLLAGSVFALTACDGGGSVGKVNGNFKTEATAQEIQTALSSIDLENAFGTGDTVALQMLAELEVSVKAKDESTSVEMSFDFAMQGPKTVLGAVAAAQVEEDDPEISWKDYAELALGQFVSKGSFDFTMKQSVSGQSVTTKVGADVYQDATSLYLDLNMNGMSQKGKIGIADVLDLIEASMEPEFPDDDWIIDSDTDSDIPGPSEGDIEIMDPSEIFETVLGAGFKTYIDDSKGLKIKLEGDSKMILDAFAEAEMPIDASMLKSSVFDVYLAFDENGLFTQLGVDLDVQVSVEGTKMTIKGGWALKPYSGTVTLPSGIALNPAYIPIPLEGLGGGNLPII